MTTKREGALGGHSVAQEIHRGLLEDTFLSVDDSAKMAQLLEKRLQMLNGLPHGAACDNDVVQVTEHEIQVCQTLSIILWNVFPVLRRPKGRWRN